ncbi:DNA cytosine methyltransferase [Nocardia sp. NPDC058518]|uniref:DNA cytosine methyltransferase n=1 Tax=Nocardia sp. NPDC058518 TaxID=3346534 RepID=UPI00364A4A9E
MSSLSVIEICAGAGGQALGLHLAGFQHEVAVELDKTAADTLRLNMPDCDVRTGDVADLSVFDPADFAPERRAAEHLPPIDLVAGGVPCPPFSIAGKQLGANDERDLFAWAVEQVEIIQPRALLLENVRGLSMPRFAGYRQHVLDRLDQLGYHAEWRLINASDYGVPQLRPRFVLVAMHPDEFKFFQWPERASAPPLTVGETLRTIMGRDKWKGADAWAAAATGIAPTIVGGSKKHGGADLGPTRAKRAWAEMGVDAKGVHDVPPPYDKPPYDKRPMTPLGPKLTVEMVARLQGWVFIDHMKKGHQQQVEKEAADDPSANLEYRWKFEGRKTSRYRQIGNAFPPPVARAIGTSIARALRMEGDVIGREVDGETDPVYRALIKSGTYLSVPEIASESGLALTDLEIRHRINLLSRDFEIRERARGSEPVYKLGEFRAFTGQDDHLRHEHYRTARSRIS